MSLNIIAWHDRDTAGHKQMVDSSAANGFRTLSLCIYGERNDPRYAAVMIKRPNIIATEQHFQLNAAQFQAKFNEMAAKGWGPYLVSATGPANDPLFAVSFTPVTPTPLTRFNIDWAEMDKINDEQMLNGGILRSADAYGTPDNIRYVAVWYPNPERVSWTCDSIADPGTVQQWFNAVTSAGGRPVLMASTPNGGLLEVFTDTTIGSWGSRVGMTSQQYQEEFNKHMAMGLAPVCVSAQGSGSNARFAAIFCSREDVDKRTFRATGPTTVAGIDQVMEKYLKAHNIRNASLAITKGSRLVYAKGYTWAEDAYPTVQPTTLFRQASVSKTIVSLAMHQIMEQNPKITLDTTMQSILSLNTPAGKLPGDPLFNQITIRHLLESTSSVDRGGIWQDDNTALAFGGKHILPVSPDQLARYIASLQLETTDGKKLLPGDTKNVKYNNTGYFLLSLVVAKLRGSTSFESAIKPMLLAPLGITRIRQSQSLVSAQLPDEARYQLRYLREKNSEGNITTYQRAFGTALSVRTADKPIVPAQYGGWSSENHDGAGGLSAAATDLARIVAMFSSGSSNPVLKSDTLNQMLANAANCRATYSGAHPELNEVHGFHGFDGVDTVNKVNNIYKGWKGGWLPASANGFNFVTGGLGFVICLGSNGGQGVTMDWENGGVRPIAEQQNWGDTDLFPHFGMPSFAPGKKQPVTATDVKVTPQISITEAISMQQDISSMPHKVHHL